MSATILPSPTLILDNFAERIAASLASSAAKEAVLHTISTEITELLAPLRVEASALLRKSKATLRQLRSHLKTIESVAALAAAQYTAMESSQTPNAMQLITALTPPTTPFPNEGIPEDEVLLWLNRFQRTALHVLENCAISAHHKRIVLQIQSRTYKNYLRCDTRQQQLLIIEGGIAEVLEQLALNNSSQYAVELLPQTTVPHRESLHVKAARHLTSISRIGESFEFLLQLRHPMELQRQQEAAFLPFEPRTAPRVTRKAAESKGRSLQHLLENAPTISLNEVPEWSLEDVEGRGSAEIAAQQLSPLAQLWLRLSNGEWVLDEEKAEAGMLLNTDTGEYDFPPSFSPEEACCGTT